MTIRQDEVDALRRVADAARAAGGGYGLRSPEVCGHCGGRLDTLALFSGCKGPGCPGHELRVALKTLDLAVAGPPYAVWVTPAAGETSWPDGRWAERSTGEFWKFDTVDAAEKFAQDARAVARAHWRYEVRSSKPPPNLCVECGAFAPSGRVTCPTCDSLERLGGRR